MLGFLKHERYFYVKLVLLTLMQRSPSDPWGSAGGDGGARGVPRKPGGRVFIRHEPAWLHRETDEERVFWGKRAFFTFFGKRGRAAPCGLGPGGGTEGSDILELPSGWHGGWRLCRIPTSSQGRRRGKPAPATAFSGHC